MNRPQREELVLGPKEKTTRKPVQGAWPWTSLSVYVGHNRHIVRPDYDMIPPRTGRKCFKARKTALSSRQFICQERNSSFHSPLAGLPSKTAPQPVIDASVVIIWRRWIAPILTPLRRKTGSRHIKRGRQQLRDTLIRRVAGTVGCNLSSFTHQRNGLMWSNRRGNTGEAAAMRPISLRQVPTETWWPSLKRARHAVRSDIQAGAKRACIWTESKRTPRNTVRWDGRSTLFLAFILRPREWMWPRTISLWRLTSSLE